MKESRLLTDEERRGGYPWLTEYKEELDWYLVRQDTKSVKARDKEWVKWGIEPCPHWADVTEKVIKRDCSLCWQERRIGEK